MKRKILTAISLTIIISLTGCGNNGIDKTESNKNQLVTNKQDTPNTTGDNEENNNNDNIYTMEYPGLEMYFNYSRNLRKSNEGSGIVLYNDPNYCTAICAYDEEEYGEFKGNLEDIPELFNEDFIMITFTAGSADISGEKYEVVSKEKVTIAGQEGIKFIGKVNKINRNNYDCYVSGYCLMFEGKDIFDEDVKIPVAVIGIVSSCDQEQEMKDSIDKTTLDIANTIRDHE